jgi:GDP-4-dehydro-6-deoxy-D-mannose reductase
LVQTLERDGVEVHSVGTRQLDRRSHHLLGDVGDLGSLTHLVEQVQPDYAFHLAGVSAASNTALFFTVNTEYAVTLLTALDQGGRHDCPVLLAGSAAEYGLVSPGDLPITEDHCPKPFNSYGISKLAQTHVGLAASAAGRPIVVVRPFNVVGPGMPARLALQSFATQLMQIRAGLGPSLIEVGDLSASRDFIDVRDAVSIYRVAIRSVICHGQIINVCSGRERRLSDVLATMCELAGVTADLRQDPARTRTFDAHNHYGSTRKLEALLGVRPLRSFATTLSDILAHTHVGP